MWQQIIKYLGVELGKALIVAIKDWYQEYKLKREAVKKDEQLKKKERLFIALEAARIAGNVSEIERLARELYKLPRD